MHGTLRLGGALALGIAVAAAAAEPPAPAVLEAGLAGHWHGTLGYRDYQSDKLFELPVITEIRALPDGATILRTSTYDDGPKAGAVLITTASLHDTKESTVTSASLRKGRSVELSTERLSVTAHTDPTHWTIVATEDGTDNDKPALVRVTEVRDGDTVTATKDVQPKAGDAVWRFRNILRLTRDGDR